MIWTDPLTNITHNHDTTSRCNTAIGVGAMADYVSVVVGEGASALLNRSTAIGSGARALAVEALAIGSGSTASGGGRWRLALRFEVDPTLVA
jgi:hypothetical protein